MNWKRKIQQWIGLQPRAKPQVESLSGNAGRHQVIIGFDFGAAFTKVVISVAGQKYGVPLNGNKPGVDRYLLPTRLYEDSSGNYTVYQPTDFVSSHTDLKMRILDDNLDDDARKLIVIYIAWVLQKSRNWLMSEKQAALGVVPLTWEVNVGLPTMNYTGDELQKKYQKLVQEAWSMSVDSHIVGESGGETNNIERELHPERIGTFPEFVAQIQGYICSPQRQSGIHTLIDIGAGTVDATVFIVHQESEEHRHPILAAPVKKLGTAYLAAHRCRKLGQSSGWQPSPQDLFPSPDKFAEKLDATLQQIDNADAEFRGSVRDQIHSLLKHAKEKMAPTPPLQTYEQEMDTTQPEKESEIPLMLCGGGAHVEFYKKTADILVQPNYGYPLYLFDLPELDKLDVSGFLGVDSERLSVAYGLSFDAFQIGKITHPDPIIAPVENAGYR